MGVVGYYCRCSSVFATAPLTRHTRHIVGLRQNDARRLEVIRSALQDYALSYAHLYERYFIPQTMTTSTLAGGVKQLTGRTPI